MTASHADLERFVQAQAPVRGSVLAELRDGRKRSHWMWFVFPQLVVLGRSDIARRYGLVDARHARAFWDHPVLGPRLAECCRLVLAVKGRTAHEIFGSPDDLKLCSSLTLFEAVAPEEPVFGALLQALYAGQRDVLTLSLLGRGPGGDRDVE